MASKKSLQSLDDLKPAPYNPRSITAKAAAGLGKSIESFGDLSGLVWNSRSGCLVAGHQRLTQLKERGATFVDGAVALPDGERSPAYVDVVVERWENLTGGKATR